MKRRWSITLWAGFLVVLAAFLTYVPFFSQFPVTRDFPWANLLMFGAGLSLMVFGLRRVYREPQRFRGKVAGPILLSLGVLVLASFCFVTFYLARQLPPSTSAPRVGQKAPDFTLLDRDGHPVTLSALLQTAADGPDGTKGAVLIFYRGYW